MCKSMKAILLRLGILLYLQQYSLALIIPEELPTILSLIYSNIPPIKKGTDSRFGVGFRLGEHADFQVLVEVGPQKETDPIGTGDSKRRRQAMLSAAMRGDLGPVAQAVAKYQTERKIQQELEKLRIMEESLKNADTEKEKNPGKDSEASEWLVKWSKGKIDSSEENPGEKVPLGEILTVVSDPKSSEKRLQRRKDSLNGSQKNTYETIEQLYKLYSVKSKDKNR